MSAPRFDVAVVGGGMVGAVLAVALSRADFSVALVEAERPAPFDDASDYDLRLSAIAPGPRRVLDNLGLWAHVEARRCCAFTGMKVWDAGGGPELFLEHTAVGLPELGHIVENALVVDAAWRALDRVELFCPARMAGLSRDADCARLALDDGRELTAVISQTIARWDGQANTSTSYIRADGWLPGGRMKQYRGGHDERWGGVTINIDSNYLDLGRGSVAPAERHCGGVRISFNDYVPLFRPVDGKRASKRHVKALQCYLTERKLYDGPINGMYHQGMLPVVQAWRKSRGISTTSSTWYRRDWMTITAYGAKPLLKVGHASKHVRRVQRTLNAAHLGSTLSVTGTFDNRTTSLVRTYQGKVGLPQTGIVDRKTWNKLMRGRRG